MCAAPNQAIKVLYLSFMFGVVVSTPPLSLTKQRLHLPPALLGAVEIRRLMVGGRQPSPLRVTTLELISSEPRRRGDRYQVPRTVHQHGSSQGSQTSRTSFVHSTRLQGHWLRMSKRSSDSPWATSRVQATVDCPERNEGMRESGVPKQAPQIFHKYLQPRGRRAGGRFTRVSSASSYPYPPPSPLFSLHCEAHDGRKEKSFFAWQQNTFFHGAIVY